MSREREAARVFERGNADFEGKSSFGEQWLGVLFHLKKQLDDAS